MKILFHGTCGTFDSFSEEEVGRGGDPNSALGVHLTQSLDSALGYADHAKSLGEGDARILIVALPDGKDRDVSLDEFFGADEEGNYTAPHEHFARWRKELLQQGYDTVEVETGEEWIVVALDPSRPQILGQITPEQAMRLIETGFWPDAPQERIHALTQAGAVWREGVVLPAKPSRPRLG